MSQGNNTQETLPRQNLGKVATLTLCVLVFILNMDITIVNVALPSLGTLPDATDSKLQWIIASYALAASAAVIPSGTLLDRHGPRRVLAIATLLFSIASLAAALSPSAIAVIISRILMGLGSSAILTGSIATLTLYYQGEQKARAFGLWSACAAIGLAAGPLVGGWLISVVSWQAIFLVNVPLGFLAAIAVVRTIPPSTGLNEGKFDVVSIVALSLALLSGTAGLIEFGAGRTSLAISMAVCFMITLAVFIVRQRGSGPKLLDDQVLQSRTMLTPLFVLVALFTVMSIILFLLPSSFELGLGNGPLASSLYILPLPLGIAIATLLGGYILNSLSTAASLYMGLLAIAVGLVVVNSQNPTSPSPITLLGLACIGLGVGIGQPVALQAAVGAFAPEQRGVGAGFVNSIRLASNAAGAAIAGGTLDLIMRNSEFPVTSNNLVEGASSCGGSRFADSVLSAGDLCTVYLDGVKLVFVFCLVLVVVAVVAVSFWNLFSRKENAASAEKGKTQS